MSKQKHSCQVDLHARVGAAFIPYLREQVRKILDVHPTHLGELSVVLVSDKQIAALHDEFFGDPTTTDVITFPLVVDAAGRASSGELYVCVPMARRQAKVHGVNVRDELLLYVLHGVLHLDGHDDMTESGYQRMHKKEDAILTKLGVGAVFASIAARESTTRGQ